MGQTSKNRYRVDESSGSDFLSPTSGTFTVPIRFLPYAIGVFGLAFLSSCITASIMTPVQNSEAIDSGINANINSVAYYVNISSNNGNGGTISKDIQATYMGTLGVINDVLKVTSNTPSGYQIYVSAASGHDQKLTNTTNSAKFLSPIDSAYSLPSTLGTLATANTWGVAVDPTYNSAFVGQDYTGTITQSHKFAPLPAYNNEKLLASKTTATTGGTDTINVYYGYHANSALPSGTYANTVLYTAYAESSDTGNHVATYDGDLDYKNGGEVVFTTSIFTDRDVSSIPATVTVTDGTTTKSCENVVLGKVEAGTNDSVTITCDAPTWSKPGNYTATISIPSYGYTNVTTTLAYGTPGIVIASGTYAGTYKTMQSMTNNVCQNWAAKPDAFTSGSAPSYAFGSTLGTTDIDTAVASWSSIVTPTADVTTGSSITNINANVPEIYLKDTRDGNYYRIRKLADGNCWMTENLRLTWNAGDNVITQNSTYNSETDIWENTQNWTPTNSTDTVNKGSGNPTSGITAWGDSSNNPSGSSCSNTDTNCIASQTDHSLYNTYSASTARFINDGDKQTVGVYYNWYAATAGTGLWSMTSGEASDSICPKGWQLPSNSGSKSYQNLIIDTYGAQTLTAGNAESTSDTGHYHNVAGAKIYAMSQTMRRAPLSIPFSGYYNYGDSKVYNVGGGGYFWSSTAYSGTDARDLGFYSRYLYPQVANYKGYGFTVRCVAQ